MAENVCMHKIVVDKMITINMDIPVELDALEFKALMTKASKIFNLSDTSLLPENTANITASVYRKWSDSDVNLIKSNLNKPLTELAIMLNTTPRKLYAKITNLKRKGKL